MIKAIVNSHDHSWTFQESSEKKRWFKAICKEHHCHFKQNEDTLYFQLFLPLFFDS